MKKVFTNYLSPITRKRAKHHVKDFQVTFTISASEWMDDPATVCEMVERIFMNHNPINKWSQITIQHIDEVKEL